ncbi:HD domain-containing protein [Malonomonas rubra DSM 5091]|uniref:HD domain-containing protein n=1 Tax=Malonomonas rubra DSM 5091 TaxID=1122189 RepID=A0A1M6DB85_MALRU|nr:HD domain-containing protein [Malonomonas rubra]SHI70497.1 HD domain-containing protein [Malonomonas rubra DSM 5091]
MLDQLPEILQLDAEQKHFLQQVRQVMETYFGTDIRRITHAQDVTGHVIDLLQYIDADPVIAICAGLLHDIGIPEAERKYGRCDGKSQEIEGPPVARMLLADVGADESLIDVVCELVANHHTPNGVDSPEFRILWDADALVNLTGVVEGKEPYAIESILDKAMVTEPGYRLACKIYLPAGK